jgi:predicted SAM-dependent methyltransferase
MPLRYLTETAKNPLKSTKDWFGTLPYFGTGRWCPVCGKASKKFRDFGAIVREEALCVHCRALERHRFLWLYLSRMTDLFDGRSKKVLHIAPEPCLAGRLKARLGEHYITADLFDARAMVRMDVTDIQYPDDYFDVIYCSHVLEHVSEDRKAMREFYRVLKQAGWAILLVPITVELTVEDPAVTDPAERLRLYGQEDHVRRYGKDYVDRLREAGFEVRVDTIFDLFQAEDRVRMGLTAASGEIYYCRKNMAHHAMRNN